MPLFKSASAPSSAPNSTAEVVHDSQSSMDTGHSEGKNTPNTTTSAAQQFTSFFTRKSSSHITKSQVQEEPQSLTHQPTSDDTTKDDTPIVAQDDSELPAAADPSSENQSPVATPEKREPRRLFWSQGRKKSAKTSVSKIVVTEPKSPAKTKQESKPARQSSISSLAQKLEVKLQGTAVLSRNKRQVASSHKEPPALPRSKSLFFKKKTTLTKTTPKLKHKGSSLSMLSTQSNADSERRLSQQSGNSLNPSSERKTPSKRGHSRNSACQGSISSRGSREDDGASSLLRYSGRPSSVRMIDRVLGKANAAKNRNSEDSSSSMFNSSSRTGSVNFGAQPGFTTTATATAPLQHQQQGHQLSNGSSGSGVLPFPMLRSQSSVDATPAHTIKSDSARRRTEGDIRLSSRNGGIGSANFLLAHEEGSDSDELTIPPPAEGATPSEYAESLVAGGFGCRICETLAATADEFNVSALRAYVSGFKFNDEPLDMSLRKFLFYVKLPLETQQTERVLQSFAATYHEQNDWIFAGEDQVYFLVFSMVMLHTDTFNKNVRTKMNRNDYVKTVVSDCTPPEICEYYFDNITSFQFVNADDLFSNPAPGSTNQSRSNNIGTIMAITNGPGTQLSAITTSEGFPLSTESSSQTHTSLSARVPSSSLLTATGTDTGTHVPASGALTPLLGSSSPGFVANRRSSSFARKDALDPYVPIIDGTLWKLRVNFSVAPNSENIFYSSTFTPNTYERIVKEAESSRLTINLTSHRSRPDAFELDPQSSKLDLDANTLLKVSGPGVVSIKVAKLGIFLRRESKKVLYSKTNWREWGVLLTSSKLYLFKNPNWVKSLLAKPTGTEGLIAQVPLEEFNATITLPTEGIGAVLSSNAQEQQIWPFVLISRTENFDGQTWFACTSEEEMKEWVDLLNFTGTYATYQVPTSSSHGSQSAAEDEISVLASGLASTELKDNLSPGSSLLPSHPSQSHSVSLERPSLSPKPEEPPREEARHRIKALNECVKTISKELATVDESLAQYEKHLLHLKILTPLLPRTRDNLQNASNKYLAKCEWAWQERARLESYKNALETDLRIENWRRLRGSMGPTTSEN